MVPLEVKGRVLVVGDGQVSAAVIKRLTRNGFRVALAEKPDAVLSVSSELKPEAVLFTTGGKPARDSLSTLRGDAVLRRLPLLGDLSGAKGKDVRHLELDEWIHDAGETVARVSAALTARRLAEREAQARLRMEMLLEITRAATSSLELGDILSIAVERVSRVIASDRTSVVLVETQSPRKARVVACHGEPNFRPMEIDLLGYPELRKALETRRSVHIDDVSRDPVMAEVREQLAVVGVQSVLIEPLICQDDVLGALFLRLSRKGGDFGRDDVEFARAAAGALANSVRNATLHQGLRKKRDDFELAYVERYRELSEANRRLREANRLKDEVLAICSHDLRSPLNVLLGHGRMLVEAGLPPAPAASAQAVLRQAKKVLQLVESLLERGTREKHTLSLQARFSDLSSLCQEVVRELGIVASARETHLRANTLESLPVIGDATKLSQVLQNLLANAINHSPEGGEVSVTATKEERPGASFARVSVRDHGPGIAEGQLQAVFERYRHGPGGTGLGLAICREIIELHGGEIWAQRPKTGGTEIVFTVPLLPPAPAESSPLPRSAGHRVLVVEDEPDVASALAEALKVRYRVEVARDGAEGLAKARSFSPDLIFMDVFLPELDGLDAALALKSSPDTAGIPIVFLSAQPAVADKVRALNLGAVDYLAKPIQALELIACTDRAIRLREAEGALQRSRLHLRRAGHDPETGTLDGEGFKMRFAQEASRCRRHGRELCLASLSATSPIQDKAATVAAAIQRRVRASDAIAYLGNGVFALLMTESSAESVAANLAQLAEEIREEHHVGFKTAVVDGERGNIPLDQALVERLNYKGLIA